MIDGGCARQLAGVLGLRGRLESSIALFEKVAIAPAELLFLLKAAAQRGGALGAVGLPTHTNGAAEARYRGSLISAESTKLSPSPLACEISTPPATLGPAPAD